MTPRDYTRIVFAPLRTIPPEAISALMNDPDVRRHLPLARGHFGAAECEAFLAAKEAMWETHGYGPWAFVLGDAFIGWGGAQPEGPDIDIGLILHRAHWGAGRQLYQRVVTHAFAHLAAESVITLLPPSRTRVAGLQRLGFRADGAVRLGQHAFNRYRLTREEHTRHTSR